MKRKARSLVPLIARLSALAVFALLVVAQTFETASAQSSVRPPGASTATQAPQLPGVQPPDSAGTGVKPGNYDIELWKKVRQGVEGQVSIPDKKAGRLVQTEGEIWRNLRNGPIPQYGAWAMAGIIGLLAVFFLIRGRIKIDHGWAGRTITRFNDLERAGHWLLAVSFIILGLTGLNVLYGRYVLLPVMGKEAFAAISMWGKWLHNHVAFAFMVGLALTFVMWIRHNFPNRHDLVWMLKAGGLFMKGVHPPARKFNAGQKILFWLVMLGGLSISLSGIALMFPFETAMFAKTFAFLNNFGFNLPTDVSPLQEMQLATLWHGIVAIVLTCVIIGHIYIGTIGMQGAFDAMGSGEVDLNWAKEHHSLWVEEELAREREAAGSADAGPRPQPAE